MRRLSDTQLERYAKQSPYTSGSDPAAIAMARELLALRKVADVAVRIHDKLENVGPLTYGEKLTEELCFALDAWEDLCK